MKRHPEGDLVFDEGIDQRIDKRLFLLLSQAAQLMRETRRMQHEMALNP